MAWPMIWCVTDSVVLQKVYTKVALVAVYWNAKAIKYQYFILCNENDTSDEFEYLVPSVAKTEYYSQTYAQK